jgi:hypothetical protein
MKLTPLAVSTLAFALTVGTGAAVAQYRPVVQQRAWNGQESQYQNQYGDGDADDAYGSDGYARQYLRFQQRGYREGYRGAYKDFENHRSPTPLNRDEYRDPDDVPRQAVRAYRIAFRQGYLQAQRQLQAGPYAGNR